MSPEGKVVAVTSTPGFGAPDDQEPSVSGERVAGAEHIAVRRGDGRADERVRPDVVHARLAKVAARFLLCRPVLVSAEEDDLAVIGIRHERRVDGEDLRIDDGWVPRHVLPLHER
jgi:hypothetical protein